MAWCSATSAVWALVLINYGREAKRVRLRGVADRATLAPLHPTGLNAQRGPMTTVAPSSAQVFDLH